MLRLPIPALLLAAGSILSIPAAHAQVTTDSHALDALGGGQAAPQAPATSKPAAEPAHHARPKQASRQASAPPPAAPATATPVAGVHPAPPLPPPLVGPPPPVPVLAAPVVDVPLHPAPMPLLPPFEPNAPGHQFTLPDDGGLYITYAPGSAVLNNETNGALFGLMPQMLKAHPQSRIEIDAFAGPNSNDESAVRRLSLQRGLGIRAILMHLGVPATRIYVRALGTLHPDGLPGEAGARALKLPPDHADVVLVGPDAPIPAASPGAIAANDGAHQP